jgi:hypothetical protein
VPLVDREVDDLYRLNDDGASEVRDGGKREEGEHQRTTSAMIYNKLFSFFLLSTTSQCHDILLSIKRLILI